MWRYNDYLTVSEDFIPVFSEDEDKNRRDNWKSFIPHTYMKELMEKVAVALERSHSKDKLSLWLTGAYGTGKTYASFVIKHLLEDPMEEVKEYLLKYELVSSLWPRFRAIRSKAPYLVIYRSSSGQITSNRRLMIEIQQAIKERLSEQGYKDAFSEGIMDQLVAKLDDDEGILNWDNIVAKYRGRFGTVATAAQVIDRLRAGDMKLGAQVAEVLEAEGQTLIDSPSQIKDWIKRVIEENGLEGIVFIWDEFTEFFSNNVPVTPLQELAHSTADMPFYLFLITHKSVQQFRRIDDQTRRKLMDRFHHCRLEMSPVTAYKLIGNVVEADPNLRDDWETKQDSLWSQVEKAALQINLLGEAVSKEELRLLPPIHPYTAYLLATISSLYSSSQRTFFRFLKEKEEGSFQWFISNYPHDGWYWLTPDYLWQYFFEKMKIEDIDAIADILSHYNAVKDKLNGNQIRIFRVMMLLMALQQRMGSPQSYVLLRPRLLVIERMFLGTDLYDQAQKIATELVEENIVISVSAGDDREYMIPRAIVDREKMQQYEQRVKANLTFEKMIDLNKRDAEFAKRLQELLLLQGAAKRRCHIKISSAKQLRHMHERIIEKQLAPYQIGIIFVVAREDDHLVDTETIAKEISEEHPQHCILIGQRPFGGRQWTQWLDFKAKSWYYQEMRDTNMSTYYNTKADDIVKGWLEIVRTSQIRAFFGGEQEELPGCQTVPAYIVSLIEKVYPDGPEQINTTSTLYVNPWGKAGAEIGLQISTSLQRPYRDVVEELDRKGLWADGDFGRHSGHPVAKMKMKIDTMFKDCNSVNIHDLWLAMQKPPYGLMPSPMGILLFSFLLKDYANGYYYSDGINSLALNPHKLASLITDVLKGVGMFETYTIRKMSAEAEEFCRLVRDAFGLTPEQAAYPEEARKNLISLMIGLGYPLWAINYCQETYQYADIEDKKKAVKILTSILVYDRDEPSDAEMGEIVDIVSPVKDGISRCLNRNSLKEGMERFCNQQAPEMKTLAEKLGLDMEALMSHLRSWLNEDVNMWHEDRVREILPIVVMELDLVHAMNVLCGTRKRDLNSIRDYFRNHWFSGKLPLLYYREGQSGQVASLIDYIYELVYGSNRVPKENKAEAIRTLKGILSAALKANAQVTRVLVKKITGQEISLDEADALYQSLPDLSREESDKIKQTILKHLSQQARQKKITALQSKWEQLTGTKSPSDWSNRMRTPIQWVLQGREYDLFFERYGRLRQLSEREIDEVISYLNDHLPELDAIKDEGHVRQCFIQVAAGDYASLIKRSNAEQVVQDYIYRSIKGDVHGWPRRLNEINQQIKKWVQNNYHSSTYPKLIKVIDNMAPKDMKSFIKELVSRDALVGVRLLDAIEDQN